VAWLSCPVFGSSIPSRVPSPAPGPWIQSTTVRPGLAPGLPSSRSDPGTSTAPLQLFTEAT